MFIVNQKANTKSRNVRLKLRVSEKNQFSLVGYVNSETDRQTFYRWVEAWREWLCLHVWHCTCVYLCISSGLGGDICASTTLLFSPKAQKSVWKKRQRDESKEIVVSRNHRSLAPINSLRLWEHAQWRFKLKPDEIP